MHVPVVDDQPAPAVRIVQRGADHAGLAAAQRGHRVEQVGEAAHARIQRGADGGVIGSGVAGADEQPCRGQLGDLRQRHLLRRQREQAHAAVRRAQPRQLVAAGRVEKLRVVHALARGCQVRPFQMDAEHTGHAFGEGLLHRRQRRAHRVGVVTDQRRQKSGGAMAPMRRADAADAFHRGRIVEQHPAAAVDLGVDEARQQQRAAQVVLLDLLHARIMVRQQLNDARAIEQHRDIIAPAMRGEYAGVGEGLRHGHVHGSGLRQERTLGAKAPVSIGAGAFAHRVRSYGWVRRSR